MTSDRSHEAVQDVEGTSHVTHTSSNAASSELDSVFNFSQLEGKDAGQQLAILNRMMIRAISIKEGAEAVLYSNAAQLTGALRQQVESELKTAEGRIEAISHRLEQHRRTVDDRDDFRTILQQARGHVRTLISLSRTATSPPTSPGSLTTPKASSLHDPETTRTRIDTMTKLIVLLQRNLRVQYELDVVQVAHAVIPALSKRSIQFSRATAYRLIRHMLVDLESIKRLNEQPFDWFLVRSLALDIKHTVEKEQAIKLIRTIVAIGSQKRGSMHVSGTGAVPLSERVMRAFIAVAEQPDDAFKAVAIQTLAEIMLIDVECVTRAGGMRVLLQTLSEGPPALASLLIPAFLYIMDSPSTRKHLRPGKALEVALSGVTDAFGKDSEHQQRLKDICRCIVCMFRTWSGLMYFCMDDMRAIRSLIDTLRIPSLEPREIVLDMFFELLNIKTPAWYKAFISGGRLTVYHKSGPSSEPNGNDTEVQQRQSEPLRLTDQYIALLVLIFTKAGLLESLTSMFQETTTGSNLSRKGTLLMAEVLQLANRILPLSLAAKIQLVPDIFKLASDYKRREHRIIGTSALSAIDSFNRNRTRLETTIVAAGNRPRANSVEDAIRRGQRQVEQVRIKMGLQMDDKTFQAALLETQVILTKDHSRWNFETLLDLIEGPLLNPKRMEEAIKLSRFLRRLMNFFHPFNHRFSDIERNKTNLRWVKLGCTLLTTLLASPDGRRFLASEDDLLKQLTRSFAQLDPFNGAPESDPIFSKKRVSETLTYGYLEMLGTLSKHKDGIVLMEEAKLFTAFYHLSELRSREDLIKGIIENIDYSIDGHPRIVLSKALTSSYKHIRLYATRHLGEMILHNPTASTWTLRLLLTQLYDPAMEVCQLATEFLEEACESVDILQLVVAMQPTLDHLGDVGHGLLLKFMSTPIGFRYLFDSGYIDREMDIWFHERNIHYVVEIEVWLAKTMEFIPMDDEDDIPSFDGVVPPHFFGEMTKTEFGCQTLHDKGHFPEFALFIRQHGHEKEDPELILKLKSILWTVGNIGASAGGLPFLEEEDIIPVILEIAEQSQVLSVRGTCFYVLGLISSTPQGAEILSDYGWEATLSPLGFPTGLCVPLDLDKFLLIPPWDSTPPSANRDYRLTPPESQAEIEVTAAISNLSNTVIAATASRSLAKLKSRPEYQGVFSSVPMFYRALHMISTSRYRLPVRRYVFDLFDIDLDEDVLRQLGDSAKSLALSASEAVSAQPNSRVVSVLFAAPRTHASGSDEEDEGSPVPQHGPPVISLRPRSTIVGFTDE
ncbi:Rapamycin-insensitive companion of mTOR, N-term-domain-containing protein [Russula earlei]|uniref:Rapamycin-insensitive companion of mTOR, N-term-domain-containing protein n=1 Tax=Russula earlei TaxID=71964 RepID=A0ACC0U268_9AGAM|nr:Rapamycin-insensitive companion of mTOR, N-term-domain-containing protein [Russula earlei]